MAKRAVAELATRDPEEIVAWGRHLDKVMAASGKEDLWAAAYLINGGCSDEGFDHFRGWLIAHGRDVVARRGAGAGFAGRAAGGAGRRVDRRGVRGRGGAVHRRRGLHAGHRLRAAGVGCRRATRPEAAMLWDFDDEDEMGRRLPRLSALFLEPPD